LAQGQHQHAHGQQDNKRRQDDDHGQTVLLGPPDSVAEPWYAVHVNAYHIVLGQAQLIG
jgi:hypothetical protein